MGTAIHRGTACACAIVTTLLATVAVAPAGARAGGPPALTCSAYTLPVAITDPGPANQTMWGQLCYRGSREPATVQLLVHGASYNHLYWDFPYGNGYYSYVDAATIAGYATFDTDRIGDGNSSHPPSSELDLTAGAVALHDAVTALRTGAVDGHPFQHVIMVGHSVGSVEAWIEAARYHDVDAVIITGALHQLNPNLPALAQADVYPAVDDPKFADSGLDSGYLTTRPGTREALFYDPATANPAWSPWMKRTRTPAPSASSTACCHSRASHSPSSLPARSTCLSWSSSAPTTTSSAPASPPTTAPALPRCKATNPSTTRPPHTSKS